MNPGATKDFTIQVKDICETAPYAITPSTPLANVSYLVARPDYITPAVDAFVSAPSYCPIKYSFSVSPTFLASDISTIQFDSTNRIYTIKTTKITLANVYTVYTNALTPLGVDTGIKNSFLVTIVDPCIAATFTLDPAIFPNPFEYIVTQTAIAKTILDSAVTSTETLVICPDIEFSLLKRDHSAYDASVFTFNTLVQSLTTFSSSQAKIG